MKILAETHCLFHGFPKTRRVSILEERRYKTGRTLLISTKLSEEGTLSQPISYDGMTMEVRTIKAVTILL